MNWVVRSLVAQELSDQHVCHMRVICVHHTHFLLQLTSHLSRSLGRCTSVPGGCCRWLLLCGGAAWAARASLTVPCGTLCRCLSSNSEQAGLVAGVLKDIIRPQLAGTHTAMVFVSSRGRSSPEAGDGRWGAAGRGARFFTRF